MFVVLRGLVDSVDLAIYSYVKPGAPHRYSLRFKDLRSYVALLTSALKNYLRSTELGVGVASGSLGFVDVGLGTLIRDSIHDNISYLRRVQLPEFHVFMIPACVAASYTLKMRDKFVLQTFLSARKSLLSYTGPQEVLKIYEALRNSGGEVSRLLYELGVTSSKIIAESLSLEEFLNILSSNYRYLSFTTTKYNYVLEASNAFIKEYEKENDWNASAIASYSILLSALGVNIKLPHKFESREDFKKILSLDQELSSKNIDYTPLIPPLTEAILISLLTIYPPKQ
ncbi:MAG: hypothetical protein QN229_03685 [Desulfurococcaceae archaeon TW002]